MKFFRLSALAMGLLASGAAPAFATTNCAIKDNATAYQQYLACSVSNVAAYNALLELYQQDKQTDAQKIWQQVRSRATEFEPLQDFEILFSKGDDYAKVAQLAERNFKHWSQLFKGVPFTKAPPAKPELPPLPELVKDEFETTSAFKARVAAAKQARERKIADIEQAYQRAVADFNQAVEANNQANQQALAEHKSQMQAKRYEYLGQAMGLVFGAPKLTNPQYNADEGKFYAHLISTRGEFDQPVAVSVPLSQARSFKENMATLTPDIRFELVQDQLKLTSAAVTFDNQPYDIALTDQNYQFNAVAVKLQDEAIPDFNRISTLTPEKVQTTIGDDAFFNAALQLEADPALAKLRQQQAELARKQKEAQLAQAREDERKRLLVQIQQQQLALAKMGGAEGDDFKGLEELTHWQFKAGQTEPQRIAVIIGNRNYEKGVPLVHYAHNDARAMKQFAEQTWGLKADQIIYEEDATKGVMEGIFKSTLPARVEKGETEVFVYFTGHGMAADKDAMLLPVDARPSTAAITGYSRDDMMQQLATLDAKSLTVVLDACYTGTDKGGKALIAAKPVLLKVNAPKAPANALLVTATKDNQIAWMDDSKGHSLLTYYLLQGLEGESDKNHDGVVDAKELGGYLTTSVKRAALTLHERSQEPQVTGPNLALVTYL